MAGINRIEVLVHPDFYLMSRLRNGEPFIHHPGELDLRRKWDDMAVAVSKDSRSRLVYFSWLSQNEIDRAGPLPPQTPWKKLDHERIEVYNILIGNRMTVAPLFPRYTPLIVSKILAGDRLTESTELYMQGEWTDQCVKREGHSLADLLKIDRSRRIIVPDNSRFSWEADSLLEWHRSFSRGG